MFPINRFYSRYEVCHRCARNLALSFRAVREKVGLFKKGKAIRAREVRGGGNRAKEGKRCEEIGGPLMEPLCLGLRPSLHRASLSDTMVLWESLRQQGESQLLQAAEEKLTIEPFKAKSPKDVEDLDSLVQTQR